MAEKTEKAAKKRTPAKSRAAVGTKKTTAKKTDDAAEANGAATESKLAAYVPTHQEIAVLALQYWEQRGRAHGHHMQDWLRAEQDLMKMAS